jgi:tetratricopeptide (TPR) repeat protein
VQLIDAETGNHLWAERFDKPLADLFDMQDEIVARLANALSAQLVVTEARRAERAPNPDSMDLYFQGLAWLHKGITRENVARARSFFDRALTADPDNVDALVGSAAADLMDGQYVFVADYATALASAEAKSARALSSAPDHARAHMWLGAAKILTKRAGDGIAACEHALALERNLVTAHSMIGLGKLFIGRAEEAEFHILEALRLSPRDPAAYAWMTIAAGAQFQLGGIEQAVAWYRRSIEANRNYPYAHFALAAALMQLGRTEDAHTAIEAGLALNPAFTLARARVAWTAMSDHPTYLASIEPVLDGLRKAGVSEQ